MFISKKVDKTQLCNRAKIKSDANRTIEKVYVMYVNNTILELVLLLLSKSTCWIETIFLRGKEAWSWLLIGVLKGKSVYKVTVVHGAGKGKIVWSRPEIIVMIALNR